ncbi:MAG: PrsW family glutamic-type intramembrane protease [Phycisphaerae bacterium]
MPQNEVKSGSDKRFERPSNAPPTGSPPPSAAQPAGQPSAAQTARRQTEQSANAVIQFVSDLVGVKPYKAGRFRELFGSVFKSHKNERIEDYFVVGGSRTTPSLSTVKTHWPKAWVSFYLLAGVGMLYMGLWAMFTYFENPLTIPGMILIGSFGVPMAVLMFFFEINVPRNVSIYRVIWMFLMGGMLSLMAALIGFEFTDAMRLNWMGAAVAGLVEEPAKVLPLLLLVNRKRYPYTLNGLLFGAAVGAGFAAFETAGYVFQAGVSGMIESAIQNPNNAMIGFQQSTQDLMIRRGMLTPIAHVVWGAMAGGMLWKVRGQRRFTFSMFADSRFLRVLGVAAICHMIFNSVGLQAGVVVFVPIGIVCWLVVFAIFSDGLRQVSKLKQKKLQESQPAENPPTEGAAS